MPSSARRSARLETAAWSPPGGRRTHLVAANDNGVDAAPRDLTRASPLVSVIAAGALAVVLIAMIAGAL